MRLAGVVGVAVARGVICSCCGCDCDCDSDCGCIVGGSGGRCNEVAMAAAVGGAGSSVTCVFVLGSFVLGFGIVMVDGFCY